MNVWRDLHHFAPSANQSGSPARQSYPIEVGGVFLGAAVGHELGVRFVAVDVRVIEMDQSIWPNLGYAYRSVRQLFKAARQARPL
jgi:hypothetical protein